MAASNSPLPSGRCIQKIDYKKLREAAEIYRTTGKKVDTKADSIKRIFHTAGGREVTEGNGIKPDIEVKHDTLANIVYYLSNDDVLTDWGTKYCQSHPTIPAVKDFTITDADYADFKKMVKDSDFKYDRQSEKRLADLKKIAEFEGYYEDAKPEFEALEKKFAHNLDRAVVIGCDTYGKGLVQSSRELPYNGSIKLTRKPIKCTIYLATL